MPLPNPVTKGETMASSRSQELPWLRELAMVSPLVTVANVVLDKHGLGRYIAKSQLDYGELLTGVVNTHLALNIYFGSLC